MAKLPEELAVRKSAGGELYYDYDGLDKLLVWCHENTVPVLGLDGMKVQGQSLVPDDDATADFVSVAAGSREEQATATLKAVSEFLAQVAHPTDLLWSVVLKE